MGNYCSHEENDGGCLECHEEQLTELREEISRLERRFLEETKAHDKTRHHLECRERELERIRSNFYKERIEETVVDVFYKEHEAFVNEFDPLAVGARIMAKKLADDLDTSLTDLAHEGEKK
jgi:hypothetical protein